jgi:2-oxoglutarate dehydrogenase E2 component (dihydrolipoamide succinyltransferase)
MSTNVLVPEVGESIVDVRVARWLKKPGDAVSAGDALVELETDKVDLEVAAPTAGVLQSIAHGDGADVKVGDVLGVIEAGGTDTPSTAASQEGTRAGDSQTPAANAERPAPVTAVEGAPARKAAPEPAPAPAAAPATAPTPASAPATTRAPQVVPAPAAARTRAETRERMSKRRATIARRLVEAQQTAALLTTFNEIDMLAVTAARERRKEAFKASYGVDLGIVSFFVRAAVAALREFPRFNAEIQGDEIVLKHYYDIGIAVGAADGLVVPVIRDADRASFAEIEARIREVVDRAGNGTLTLEDLRGGTFSITNGGIYGSLMSTPIVNPPQVAILGLHAIKQRPVNVAGQIVLRPMMYVALTYDHRIVDGAEAVRFLGRIKDLVEDPAALLIAM